MLVWRGHKAKVRSLAFSPDGRFLATTAGNSRFVWLWEAATGKLVRKLNGWSGYAMRLAVFLADGRHAAGLHERNFVSVWDTETGALVSPLMFGGTALCDSLAVSPTDGRLVGFANQKFVEWDEPARPSSSPRACDRHPGPAISHYLPFFFGFSPSGTYFWRTAVGLELWDSSLGTIKRRLNDPDNALATGCAFTPDDARVCVSFGHRAVIWDLREPDAPALNLRGHGRQVRTVGFLSGAGTAFTAGMDGTVRLWNSTTGAETRSFDWGIGKVRVATVSPDGQLCAAGSDDGHLVVWDVDL